MQAKIATGIENESKISRMLNTSVFASSIVRSNGLKGERSEPKPATAWDKVRGVKNRRSHSHWRFIRSRENPTASPSKKKWWNRIVVRRARRNLNTGIEATLVTR